MYHLMGCSKLVAKIKRAVEELARLDDDQTLSKHYTSRITLSDVPLFVLTLLKERIEPQFTFEIQDLSYEKF